MCPQGKDHENESRGEKSGRLLRSTMMYSKVKGEEWSVERETGKLEYRNIVGKRDLEAENVLGPKSTLLGAASTINDLVPLCHKFLPFLKWGH